LGEGEIAGEGDAAEFGINGDAAGGDGAPGAARGEVGEIGADDLRGGYWSAVGDEEDAGGGTVELRRVGVAETSCEFDAVDGFGYVDAGGEAAEGGAGGWV